MFQCINAVPYISRIMTDLAMCYKHPNDQMIIKNILSHNATQTRCCSSKLMKYHSPNICNVVPFQNCIVNLWNMLTDSVMLVTITACFKKHLSILSSFLAM